MYLEACGRFHLLGAPNFTKTLPRPFYWSLTNKRQREPSHTSSTMDNPVSHTPSTTGNPTCTDYQTATSTMQTVMNPNWGRTYLWKIWPIDLYNNHDVTTSTSPNCHLLPQTKHIKHSLNKYQTQTKHRSVQCSVLTNRVFDVDS